MEYNNNSSYINSDIVVAPAGVRWPAHARKRVSTASRRGADGKVPAGMDNRLSSTSIKRSIHGAASSSSSPSLPFFLSAPQEPGLFDMRDCKLGKYFLAEN